MCFMNSKAMCFESFYKQDIPALTAEAAKEHPGISYIVTAPLGLHEQLVVWVSNLCRLVVAYCSEKRKMNNTMTLNND